MSKATPLRILQRNQLSTLARKPVEQEALSAAAAILADVQSRGATAARHHAERLGDIKPGESLLIERADLQRAADQLPTHEREVLERTNARVRAFASAQRACLLSLDTPIQGGRAGHRIIPVASAGCYVPGGRFPLPSTAIMTVATARAAGVNTVIAASPRPSKHTLAAAAIAGADALLAIGGAQAIASLAYGLNIEDTQIQPCDVICGPGNRYVTAAKQLVSGSARIDMLAGPSELVLVADASASPATIAADLLAQAEHDPDASAILIALDQSIIAPVQQELEAQLATLPTAETARKALANGFAILAADISDAATICDLLAPEHLQLMSGQPEKLAPILTNYGALFIGSRSAEVLGDYGAGPNHTLPTGGSARAFSGLSVLTFLNVRTWLKLDEPQAIAQDAAALARMEGLEAHARSAEKRL
jgi:phosphoribosyl-ATP pyrophosphohydrolase/phosphoribosyl-AMP cyclohydrolase/histidinol dehydrogenase